MLKRRKSKIIAATAIIFAFAYIFCGCAGDTTSEKYSLIRIHIRADSNEEKAQAVKLKVRDRVSEYLEKELDGVTDYSKAYELLEAKLEKLKEISDETLKENGFSYTSRVRLNNEFFPTRSYNDLVVESGYYDALIIELGSGKGDNWWCVIYPPLCYLEAKGSGDIKYKSYFAELFKKYFK